MYGIVRDLIEQCIAQTPDVWEWTDEVARYCITLNYDPDPSPSPPTLTLTLALTLTPALSLTLTRWPSSAASLSTARAAARLLPGE